MMLDKDSRQKRIHTLDLLIRDNKETLRQRLEDGTFQRPDETNRLSKKVDKYIAYTQNIKILTELLNKTKREIL
jgi:2-phosphoglycerate kinase